MFPHRLISKLCPRLVLAATLVPTVLLLLPSSSQAQAKSVHGASAASSPSHTAKLKHARKRDEADADIKKGNASQNYAQAFAWYRKAAEQGSAVGANYLGWMYEYGLGVTQDYQQALAWYERAAAQGNTSAKQHFTALNQQLAAAQQQQPGQDDVNQAAATQSAAEWQQEHQAKIDELTQEIANHEQQAEQDDANAEEAAAQVQQNASANVSGPGGGFLALGNAVEGAMNAGLAEKMRQDASEERRQAQEEREQLAELGAEQPPVAQNNSEIIALTRTQTQMIQSGNTIEGALNRAQNNMQAAQQAVAEHAAAQQPEAAAQRVQTDTQQAGSEYCPNMQQYPDSGFSCNPVRNENSCIRVVSNVWNSGANNLTLVLSNTCSSPVRLAVWGPPDADPPGEQQNVGAGQQFTYSSTGQTWHYEADDGVDCTTNNDRPGCSNIGH